MVVRKGACEALHFKTKTGQKPTAVRPATVALVPVAGTAPDGPQTCRGDCLPFAIAKSGARSVMWSLCKCDKNTLLIVARLTCVAYKFTMDPVPASNRKF